MPTIPRNGTIEIETLCRYQYVVPVGSRFKGTFTVERITPRSQFFADVIYSIKIGPIWWEATLVLKPPSRDSLRKVRMTQSDRWEYILGEVVRYFELHKTAGKNQRFRVVCAQWQNE